MLKKLGLTTLGLAAGLTLLAPTVTMARDRNDYRGRGFSHDNQRHEFVERRSEHDWRDHNRGTFGVGVYTAPAPAANGYYDQFGNWHPYGYYDQYGYWHQY